MRGADVSRAVAVAVSVATSVGLAARQAVVLNNSNKLTLRLLPANVVARVAPAAHQVAQLELELAGQLLDAGCPVVASEPRVEPRVHERDGFVVTLWTHHESVAPSEVEPADYAQALVRLHRGMRTLDVVVPHVVDRVGEAEQLLASQDDTPGLADADRALLRDTLAGLSPALTGPGSVEQLLHGEPHPGNLLSTRSGLLLIDLETCCRGPVEFDLAHAPYGVGEHYPGADRTVLNDCRTLVLAMVTTWRWDRHDQLPDGRRLATEWLRQLRAARAGDAHG